MKFKTQFNSHEFPSRHEVYTLPSLTVPDQSMSLSEIVRRFASGLPFNGQKVPLYEDDPENAMPDITHWDLADQEEYTEQVKQELLITKQRIAEEKQKKAEAKKKAQESLKQVEKSSETGIGNNPDSKAKLPAEGDKMH